MILRGTPATLEVICYVDGTAVDPTGTPTCAVVDEAGNAIASGNAVIAGGDTGKLQFALTGTNTANVNRLTATWANVVLSGQPAITLTTREEVVGDLLFTEAAAREFDQSALTSAVSYPDATILAGRDRIAESFADVTAVAMGLHYGREVLDGDGGATLWLAANEVGSVRSIKYRDRGTATWTAFTADELADVLVSPNGRLEREILGTFPAGRRNIAVEYEHGFQPIPEELRLAALRLLRNQLVASNIPDRALSQTDSLGTFQLAIASAQPGRWFGLPTVDSVLVRYRKRVPGVA
jgi:hypothetical protein